MIDAVGARVRVLVTDARRGLRIAHDVRLSPPLFGFGAPMISIEVLELAKDVVAWARANRPLVEATGG